MRPKFLSRVFLLAAMANTVIAQENPIAAAVSSEGPPSRGALRADEILKRYPPPGQMVDIGERRLHMLCKGTERPPVIVIEGGSFASSYMYWSAQDEIAKVARVCTYDRAGLGWSDATLLPRSLESRIDDLHSLLRKSGQTGPYVLVGHSMGGLLVRMYEHKYPGDVVGLVLVEPSNERFNGSEGARKRSTQSAAQVEMAFAVLAAGGEIPQLRIPNGPPEQAIVQRESVFRAGQDDLVAMSHLDVELQKFVGLGALGAKPLVVITRGKPDPAMTEQSEMEWRDSHSWLATLSTRSARIVAERSGHVVNFDQPESFREAVSKAFEMLNESRGTESQKR